MEGFQYLDLNALILKVHHLLMLWYLLTAHGIEIPGLNCISSLPPIFPFSRTYSIISENLWKRQTDFLHVIKYPH